MRALAVLAARLLHDDLPREGQGLPRPARPAPAPRCAARRDADLLTGPRGQPGGDAPTPSTACAEAGTQATLLDVSADGQCTAAVESQPAGRLERELASAEAQERALLAGADAQGHDPLQPYPCPEPDFPFNAHQLTAHRSEEQQEAQAAWRGQRDGWREVRDAWNARRDRLLREAAAQRVPTGKASLVDGLVRALTRPTEGPKTTARLLVDPLSGWARTQYDELLPPGTLKRLTDLLPTSGPLRSDMGLTHYDQGRGSRRVSPPLPAAAILEPGYRGGSFDLGYVVQVKLQHAA